MEISENLEKVSGLPFMVQRKRQNTGSVRRFFFFNGFHLQVRDDICLILVLDCRVLYYFVCAKSL